MTDDGKRSNAGRGTDGFQWPHRKLWGFIRSLHPVQIAGFGVGGFELVAFFMFGRPIDKEVMPFAAALILWQSLRNRARR